MPRRKARVIPDDVLAQLLAGGGAAPAPNSGGLLDALKKALAERALNAAMDYHLDNAGEAGNTRNGYGRKTVTTSTGKVEIGAPHDPAGRFDPQLIARYQRRFPGFEDKVISVYAWAMSTREIGEHLRENYGMNASADLISTITDLVLDDVAIWQQDPLDAIYPLVFFNAIRVKIRHDGRLLLKYAPGGHDAPVKRAILMRTRSTDTIMVSGLSPRATGRTHE